MILSPNEIAAQIYWSGAAFGPAGMTGFGVTATQHKGKIIQTVPKPGSPERTKIENWLDTAIAVCLAESGGDTLAKNSSSTATGLWQILVSAHGGEISDAIKYWETNLADGKVLTIYDPRVNTMAAALVYQKSGSKFTPWQAYTSGSYKHHTGHGKAAYKFITSKKNLELTRKNFIDNLKNDQATVGLLSDLTKGLTGGGITASLPDWLKSVLAFAASAGITVGIFLLALVLVLVGLWVMVSHTKAGKSFKRSIPKVIPV